MNTQSLLSRFVLAAFLCVSCSSLRAQDQEKPKPEIPPSVLKRYDKNKDGALGEAEIAKWEADKAAVREKRRAEKAAMLEKYDTNKNGKLDEEESAAAKLGREKEKSEKAAEQMKERAAKEKAKAEAEKAKAEQEKAQAEKQAAEKPQPKPGESEMSDGMMMQ